MEYGRLVTGAGTKVGGPATLDSAIRRTKMITILSKYQLILRRLFERLDFCLKEDRIRLAREK